MQKGSYLFCFHAYLFGLAIYLIWFLLYRTELGSYLFSFHAYLLRKSSLLFVSCAACFTGNLESAV